MNKTKDGSETSGNPKLDGLVGIVMDIDFEELLHIICVLDDYDLRSIGVDDGLVDQIHDIASEANPNGKLEH